MHQQKDRYFKSLLTNISTNAQQLSNIITLHAQSNFHKDTPLPSSSNSQQLHFNSQFKNKDRLPIINHSPNYSKENGKGKQDGGIDGCSQDKIIEECGLQLANVKKKREQFQKQQAESSDILKKMKVEKQILACLRKQQDLRKEIQYQLNQKQKKTQRYEQIKTQKQHKKQQIQHKLHKIAQQRDQRTHILSAKSMPSVPKYKIIERVFLMQELKRQLDRKIEGKRLHQLRYRDYLKSLQLSNSNSSSHHNISKRVRTEVASEKKQNKKEEYQKKKEMIQLLQEKRKQAKVKIDTQSSIKFEIMKDRARNPQKYHFLKLKNLTDQQIYKEFQDYEIDFDSKAKGNEYLQQSKRQGKKQSTEAYILQSKIQSSKGRISYQEKNVDDKLKQKRKQSIADKNAQTSRKPRSFTWKAPILNESIKHKEQIGKILRQSESKSKILELLSQESSSNSRNIAELQKVLMQSNEYQEFLKVESSMDNEYLQFLKAKILALGLQNL